MALTPFDINFTHFAYADDNFTSENTTDYPLGRGYTEQVTFDLWHFIYENDTSFNDSFVETDPVYPGAGFPSGYTWPTIIISTCFIVILVILVGLGNGLVCIAIYTDKNLKITQNAFIASLAVADMLLGLVVMPFSWCNEMMGYWFFGNVWCDLWLSIDVLLCTASILNLVLISLDRYWSITRALHYPQQRTPKRAAIMIAIVWILSGIICLPPLIGWKQPRPEMVSKYPICHISEDIGYVLYSSCGSFYIPMVIMVIVYFRIYLAARNRARGSLTTKPKVVCPDNTKDKSTSSTTTSFTTPPKNNNQKSVNVATANATNVTPNSNSGGGGRGGGENGGKRGGKAAVDDEKESSFSDEDSVPVTNSNNLKVPSRDRTQQQFVQTEDEQRRLLQTDSDSVSVDNRLRTATSDSEVGEIRPPNQRLILVTDTESSIESPKKQRHQGDVSTELETVEENFKPLLSVDTDSTCFDSPYMSPETQMTDTGTATEAKTPTPSRKASNHIDQQPLQQHQENQQHNQNNQFPHGAGNHTTQYAGPTPVILTPPCSREKETNNKKHKEKSKNKKKKEHIPMINFKRKKKKTDADKNRKEQTWKAPSARDTEKHKRRIAKARERRATIVLGIVMAAFILCWCPFFTLYVVSAFCEDCIPETVFDIFFWIGYCNSALNPVIYTVFNRDFKHAFIKILFGSKYVRRY